MSITSVNAIYPWGGPTASNQIVVSGSGEPDLEGLDLEGVGVAVLDGASTTFTLNFIDGTNTVLSVPTAVTAFRSDPPAWTANTAYPANYVVIGSSHVQQAQNAGKSGSSAPTWTTNGGTVSDGTGAAAIVWKDLGAITASTTYVSTVTALTNTGVTITFSAAGLACRRGGTIPPAGRRRVRAIARPGR